MTNLNALIIANMLRESIQRGNTATLTLVSNSMYPLLKVGDKISIESVSIAQLERGDIITFVDEADDSELLTHRYWGSEHRDGVVSVITRGDRPLLFDAPCRSSNIVGRVVGRQRGKCLLPLNNGNGRWLNNRLTSLAAQELQLLSGMPNKPMINLTEAIIASDKEITQQNNTLTRKMVRAPFLALQLALTASVNTLCK